MQVIKAGDFTITTGIFHRNKHVYVTHAKTGRQWVAKNKYDGRALEGNDFSLQSQIALGIVTFHPTPTPGHDGKPVRSCDFRFWEPVDIPRPRTDTSTETAFARLCFD